VYLTPAYNNMVKIWKECRRRWEASDSRSCKATREKQKGFEEDYFFHRVFGAIGPSSPWTPWFRYFAYASTRLVGHWLPAGIFSSYVAIHGNV